jgi:hypothetical protein
LKNPCGLTQVADVAALLLLLLLLLVLPLVVPLPTKDAEVERHI